MSEENISRTLKRVEREIAQTRIHLVDLETVRSSLLAQMNGGHLSERAKSNEAKPMPGLRRSRSPAAVATGNGQALPETSGEFWLEQLGRGKCTAGDIVERAIQELKLPPTTRKALYIRAANWLNFAKKRATPLVAVVEKRDGVNVYKKV